jgi:hypothetical protein
MEVTREKMIVARPRRAAEAEAEKVEVVRRRRAEV